MLETLKVTPQKGKTQGDYLVLFQFNDGSDDDVSYFNTLVEVRDHIHSQLTSLSE